MSEGSTDDKSLFREFYLEVKKVISSLAWFFILGCVGVCVLIAISWFAKWFWIANLIAELKQQWLFILIIGMILTIFQKSWKLLLLFWVAALFCFWPMISYLIPSSQNVSIKPDANISILSFNILKYNNDSFQELGDHINQKNADVVLLYEVTPLAKTNLDEILVGYKYRDCIEKDSSFGLCIYSKNKPESSNLTYISKDPRIPVINATFKVNGFDKLVQIIGVHPTIPMTNSMFNSRQLYFQEALDFLDEASYSVVAGDFNTTYFSPTFNQIIERGNFKVAGHGRGIKNTWRFARTSMATNYLTGLRIDHVLIDQDLYVNKYDLSNKTFGSDHRSIYTELVLAD